MWMGDPDYPEIQITEGKLRDIDNVKKSLPKAKV